ncbi:hypothetical protein SV1_20 [Streptomyces phage SV1]|uniref:hypothetical protein n=1 Tax=Streptomyces phage SV1 TaxID=1204525 RepID=UPI00028AD0A9|nr:hypothetical protein D280_gp20 [Streptomyces phage SV1]AFU62160.1 hypothetical protein SV1_20 [Streptomyces phage SV1]
MAAIPQDLLDRLRRLEAEVRELRGRSQIRPAMDQILAGDVVVGEGGALSVLDPDNGHTTFRVGEIYSATGEFGTVIKRDDGTVAISVLRGPQAAPTQSQAVRIMDSAGNEILSGETIDPAGGLARPYLSLPIPQDENTASWPGSASTAWTTIGRSRGLVQHPKVWIYAVMARPAGVSAQLQLLIDGTPVVTGAVNATLTGPGTVPGYEYAKGVEFELQVKVTAGTGTVRAMTRYLYGIQS